jgi:hypothetical protein
MILRSRTDLYLSTYFRFDARIFLTLTPQGNLDFA